MALSIVACFLANRAWQTLVVFADPPRSSWRICYDRRYSPIFAARVR